MRDCVGAAKEFVGREKRLDCVVANAALSIMVSEWVGDGRRERRGDVLIRGCSQPCVLSQDGYEIQFAVSLPCLPFFFFLAEPTERTYSTDHF